jgi:hypothetical protein
MNPRKTTAQLGIGGQSVTHAERPGTRFCKKRQGCVVWNSVSGNLATSRSPPAVRRSPPSTQWLHQASTRQQLIHHLREGSKPTAFGAFATKFDRALTRYSTSPASLFATARRHRISSIISAGGVEPSIGGPWPEAPRPDRRGSSAAPACGSSRPDRGWNHLRQHDADGLHEHAAQHLKASNAIPLCRQILLHQRRPVDLPSRRPPPPSPRGVDPERRRKAQV